MVLAPEPESNRMTIYVDPGRPDVWRSEPFISQIKKWAILFLKTDAHIAVYVGKRVFVILPARKAMASKGFCCTKSDKMLQRVRR